ncbi:hypothetical protein TIFTF001_042698 [Ficus carica]|uniref:Uncharacterized protein n=1 Tax=Ficus carica TaxID=3494 RepID=A0AA88A282_FICCA|nr:hypothetical protein TIFTF001_042698 [Ficus carica]
MKNYIPVMGRWQIRNRKFRLAEAEAEAGRWLGGGEGVRHDGRRLEGRGQKAEADLNILFGLDEEEEEEEERAKNLVWTKKKKNGRRF